MRRAIRWQTVTFSIMAMTLMFLPQFARAETMTQVTENAIIMPESNNYNALENVANETSRTNIETWSPLPDGIFVGGTIPESSMVLNEVGHGNYSMMAIGTVVQLQPGYLSNGASEFIIRLPFLIDVNSSNGFPRIFKLSIYELTSTTYDYALIDPLGYPSVNLTGATGSRLVFETPTDFANIIGSAGMDPSDPYAHIWRDFTHSTWIDISGRMYARVVAPIYTEKYYLFSAWGEWPGPIHPFKMFWHSADLCSDNLTSTRIAYSFPNSPSAYTYRDYVANADAGWSFVFTRGVGVNSRDYTSFLPAYTELSWSTMVPVNASIVTSAFTFALEFQSRYAYNLTYNLSVQAWDALPSPVFSDLLSDTWWHGKVAHDILIAANPTAKMIHAIYTDGQYYILLSVRLVVQNAIDLKLMLTNDPGSPLYLGGLSNTMLITTVETYLTGHIPHYEVLGFKPACTYLFSGSYVYNQTNVIIPWNSDIWQAPTDIFSPKQWLDFVGGYIQALDSLPIVKIYLNLAGGGLNYAIRSNWAVASPLTYLLYDHWADISRGAGKVIHAIIDGLEWLGNWIWKIANWIWKALTWLVDTLIDNGGQILAILIYGLALMVPIVIITMSLKMMSIFYKIAKGDLTGATRDAKELVSEATLGRAGGG